MKNHLEGKYQLSLYKYARYQPNEDNLNSDSGYFVEEPRVMIRVTYDSSVNEKFFCKAWESARVPGSPRFT